jgi:hypothetical protein
MIIIPQGECILAEVFFSNFLRTWIHFVKLITEINIETKHEDAIISKND